MKNRISSAFKHFALSVTLRGLSQRKRKAEMKAPQPRRQAATVNTLSTDNEWLFDRSAENAVQHRAHMLSSDMNRLSETLSGLRAFLSDVAVDAPILADNEIAPRTAPMIVDRDLFDGEALAPRPNQISAQDDAEYLFQDEVFAEGQVATTNQRAQAA